MVNGVVIPGRYRYEFVCNVIPMNGRHDIQGHKSIVVFANEFEPQTIEYFESKSLQWGKNDTIQNKNNNNNYNHLVLTQKQETAQDTYKSSVLNEESKYENKNDTRTNENNNDYWGTGRGKSSLLRSLLGNLNKVDGKLLYNRKL